MRYRNMHERSSAPRKAKGEKVGRISYGKGHRLDDKECLIKVFLTGFNEPSKITPNEPRQGTPENSFRCPIMGMKMMITDP